jgi:hypothetical protein
MVVLLGLTYGLPTAISHKQPAFGGTFTYLLLFCALHQLAEVLAAAGSAGASPSRYGWRTAGVLGLACLGLACFRWPSPKGYVGSPHREGWCRVFEEIYQAVRQRAGESANVFLTEGIFPSSWGLRYRALADGLDLTFADCHRDDDPSIHLAHIDEADFVLVPDGRRTTHVTPFPCLALQPLLNRRLARRRDFVMVGWFQAESWGGYTLYQRREGFGGFEAVTGLLPPEGPYPQFDLPHRLRWGSGARTRLAVTTGTPGQAVLALCCRPSEGVRAMEIRLNGTRLTRHVFTDHNTFDDFPVPLRLGSGAQTLEFVYDFEHRDRPVLHNSVLFTTLRIDPGTLPAHSGRGQAIGRGPR